jgi:hypothetical protein
MMRCSPYAFLVLLAVALLTTAGCGGSSIKTAPPEGWQADGNRWWTDGADTAAAFRDLSTVEAMGVSGQAPVFSATSNPTNEQVALAVKQDLEKLYRKAPETVDSLFAQHVAPRVEKVVGVANVQDSMDAFVKRSHDRISENFYPPVQKLRLGEDIPVPYPDSLRSEGGSVWMQVRVGAQGKPQAIKMMEGGHPVLNDVVRRAVTQMRWEPARVRSGNYGWRDIPSWTWINVSLG